jgi:hypothetical protein
MRMRRTCFLIVFRTISESSHSKRCSLLAKALAIRPSGLSISHSDAYDIPICECESRGTDVPPKPKMTRHRDCAVGSLRIFAKLLVHLI